MPGRRQSGDHASNNDATRPGAEDQLAATEAPAASTVAASRRAQTLHTHVDAPLSTFRRAGRGTVASVGCQQRNTNHAHQHQLDSSASLPLQLVARRLYLIAACGNDDLLYSFGRQMGGRLPLELLASVAPHLAMHVQATVGSLSSAPPCEVALQMGTQLGYDGVHLSFAGFCGALCAVSASRYEVLLPHQACCVLVKQPRRRAVRRRQVRRDTLPTQESVMIRDSVGDRDDDWDWTEHAENEADSDATSDEPAQEAERRSPYSWFSASDGVNSSTCDLLTLFCRWPSLMNILRDASSAQVAAAKNYLGQLSHDEPSEPADAVLMLYHTYLCSLDLPCLLLARPVQSQRDHDDCASTAETADYVATAGGEPLPGPPTFVAANIQWAKVLGWTNADLQRFEWSDSDTDAQGSLHWIWPNQLTAVAQAAAASAAMHTSNSQFPVYSTITSFKRLVRATPPHALAGAGSSHARRHAAAPHPAALRCTRLRGVQTQFSEVHRSGAKVLDVVVLSSILHSRQPVSVSSLRSASCELDVLQAATAPADDGCAAADSAAPSLSAVPDPLAGNYEPTSLADPSLPASSSLRIVVPESAPLVHQLRALDLWTSTILRQRLAMLLCADLDPVVRAAVACGTIATATSGAAMPGLPALQLPKPHPSSAEPFQMEGKDATVLGDILFRRSEPRPRPSSDSLSEGLLQSDALPFPELHGLREERLFMLRRSMVASLGIADAVQIAASSIPQASGCSGAEEGGRLVGFGSAPPWVQRNVPFRVGDRLRAARWYAGLHALGLQRVQPASAVSQPSGARADAASAAGETSDIGGRSRSSSLAAGASDSGPEMVDFEL